MRGKILPCGRRAVPGQPFLFGAGLASYKSRHGRSQFPARTGLTRGRWKFLFISVVFYSGRANIPARTYASCIFTGSTMNGTEGASSPPSRLRFTGQRNQPRQGQLSIDSLGQDPVMMIPRFLFASLCALGSLTFVAHGGNVEWRGYLHFVLGAGRVGHLSDGINASMEVTGYYYVTPTVVRGFLREADGTITTFSVAGGVWTQPEGINAAGNITGFYQPGLQDGHGVPPQGFLRYADGHIILIEAPQALLCCGSRARKHQRFRRNYGNLHSGRSRPLLPGQSAGVLTNIQVPDGGSPRGDSHQCKRVRRGLISGSLGYTGFVAHPDGYWAEIAIPVVACSCFTANHSRRHQCSGHGRGLVLQRHLHRRP